ncbi:hypothetical protein EFN38_07910, partial [Leuconostoc mesenteroides]|nr:hypothetical protein [Leuconostoc mesenteroides]
SSQILYGYFDQLPLKSLRLFYSSVRFNFTIYLIAKFTIETRNRSLESIESDLRSKAHAKGYLEK